MEGVGGAAEELVNGGRVRTLGQSHLLSGREEGGREGGRGRRGGRREGREGREGRGGRGGRDNHSPRLVTHTPSSAHTFTSHSHSP